MQTHSDDSAKIYAMANKIIDRFMLATGIFAYVWILAFLLVAMIDK